MRVFLLASLAQPQRTAPFSEFRGGRPCFNFIFSVQNMDQVSGLADKEGWIKIIDFLKFATDTELCKIEFTDRVFASKSHFGSKDSEKEKDERKKDPKLKVNKIETCIWF